nr:MAG TPA: hypothetical protein [Caudoviricetes sp.]
MWGFSIDGPEWAVTIPAHDRGPQNNIHLRERGKHWSITRASRCGSVCSPRVPRWQPPCA